MSTESSVAPRVEINRYESLPQPLKIICLVLFTSGIGLFVWFVSNWPVRGWILDGTMYSYLLYATFSTCVFLTMPARKKDRNRIPWYDLVLAALVFGICIYFALNSWEIVIIGWVPAPRMLPLVLAGIIGLLAIEGGRRMAGTPFVIICLILGLYPLVAEHMPGILYGAGLPIDILLASFAFGPSGMLGLPAQVMGGLLIGFLIFAGMLMASGAGTFFIKLATALMGRYRGGPAKVAVLASGFFGSLSGSPMANVVSTGAFTIPAMKRLGYPTHYAGGIEAVASTGGVIMPPVMGAIAFIMAIITDIPYPAIVAAAIIPAILYYYGLLVQVDAYAARVGLKGLPPEELPSIRQTLKGGWQYLVVLCFLVFGLLYMRWEVHAAIYAAGLLFVLSFTRRDTMMTPKKLMATLATIGNLVTFMIAIFLPIGLVLIGTEVTGTLTALTIPIVTFGSEYVLVPLLIAVALCYVLGMMAVSMIPYIVIAVTVVPSLVAATGLSELGVHLFIIYYLITSHITPPIAITAFVGAAMAGAPPFKTGFTAMRLAVVLYFIPFFFLFNPALILEGPILETLYLFALCLLGIGILAAGLEGYLLKLGRLSLWSRPLLVVGGFLIALPVGWMTAIIGAALTATVVAIVFITKKAAAVKLPTGGEST